MSLQTCQRPHPLLLLSCLLATALAKPCQGDDLAPAAPMRIGTKHKPVNCQQAAAPGLVVRGVYNLTLYRDCRVALQNTPFKFTMQKHLVRRPMRVLAPRARLTD